MWQCFILNRWQQANRLPMNKGYQIQHIQELWLSKNLQVQGSLRNPKRTHRALINLRNSFWVVRSLIKLLHLDTSLRKKRRDSKKVVSWPSKRDFLHEIKAKMLIFTRLEDNLKLRRVSLRMSSSMSRHTFLMDSSSSSHKKENLVS